MSIYFMQCGGVAGPIKIGSSYRPSQRLIAFQMGCPYPLSIIREIDGYLEGERWFHSYFEALNIHGEWFRYSPDLLTVCPPKNIETRGDKIMKLRAEGLTFKAIGEQLGMSAAYANLLYLGNGGMKNTKAWRRTDNTNQTEGA